MSYSRTLPSRITLYLSNTLGSYKNASTSRAKTGCHCFKHLDNEGEPQGFAEHFKDPMRKKLSSLSVSKPGISFNCHLERKYAGVGRTRPKRKNTVMYTDLRVTWWQKDISRSQESTIITVSRLLQKRWFLDSSSLLLCIFWILTFWVGNRASQFILEPERNRIHDLTRGFWLWKAEKILGVRVKFVKNGILLSQRQNIAQSVSTFSFHKENKVYIPLESPSTSRMILASEDQGFNYHFYRQLIGSFM
jgi:hypothetical protein